MDAISAGPETLELSWLAVGSISTIAAVLVIGVWAIGRRQRTRLRQDVARLQQRQQETEDERDGALQEVARLKEELADVRDSAQAETFARELSEDDEVVRGPYQPLTSSSRSPATQRRDEQKSDYLDSLSIALLRNIAEGNEQIAPATASRTSVTLRLKNLERLGLIGSGVEGPFSTDDGRTWLNRNDHAS